MPELLENIESDLLLQVAGGSEKAFSKLFHAYRDKLFSFIYGISGSRQLAEDTVQEVFSKIWQGRSEATQIREFDSYLFRMARNHALNALKRTAKEAAILNGIDHQSTNPAEILTIIEHKEAQKTVRLAIESLPSKQKQVFILSREHGMKQADISRLLNITVPTVKSHITQAMHSIRKYCKNIYPVAKIFLFLLSYLLR